MLERNTTMTTEKVNCQIFIVDWQFHSVTKNKKFTSKLCLIGWILKFTGKEK